MKNNRPNSKAQLLKRRSFTTSTTLKMEGNVGDQFNSEQLLKRRSFCERDVPSEDSSEEVTERVRRFLEKRSKFSSATAAELSTLELELEIEVRLRPRRCCETAGIFLPPIRDSLTLR